MTDEAWNCHELVSECRSSGSRRPDLDHPSSTGVIHLHATLCRCVTERKALCMDEPTGSQVKAMRLCIPHTGISLGGTTATCRERALDVSRQRKQRLQLHFIIDSTPSAAHSRSLAATIYIKQQQQQRRRRRRRGPAK